MLLYHIDRMYNINEIMLSTKKQFTGIKESLAIDTDVDTSIDSIYVFAIALSIICLVIAIKQVLNKRKLA